MSLPNKLVVLFTTKIFAFQVFLEIWHHSTFRPLRRVCHPPLYVQISLSFLMGFFIFFHMSVLLIEILLSVCNCNPIITVFIFCVQTSIFRSRFYFLLRGPQKFLDLTFSVYSSVRLLHGCYVFFKSNVSELY